MEREGRAAWRDEDDEALAVAIPSAKRKTPLGRILQNKKGGPEHVSGVRYQQWLKEKHKQTFDPLVTDWVEIARERKRKAVAGRKKCSKRGSSWLDSSDEEEEDVKGDTISAAAADLPLKQLTSETGQEATLACNRRPEANRLMSGLLDISRLFDANKKQPSKQTVGCVKFHDTHPLLLTGGRDQFLRLFKIDGKDNPRCASIHLPQFRFEEAVFTAGGTQATLLGPGKALLEYDLTTGSTGIIPGIGGRRGDTSYSRLAVGSCGGRELFAVAADGTGSVLLCDAKTKHLIRPLKMNAPATAVVFHPQSPTLITADEEAFIYEWDIASGACLGSFHDESALSISSLAVSPPAAPSPIMAVGSRSGYVNFFSIDVAIGEAGRLRSLSNLTTSVSSLCFHPSGELLCAASQWKPNALRMIHSESLSVYSNWPTFQSPLHHPCAADFSACGRFFAVGNDSGRVRLYQLNHYC
eukprot:GHVS01090237.1.p1 GENE.GHVS01090237.1~~GHVS01090237.1.p1  ORF type:complete len:469 (-),score=99.77 GHVS01090237.1:264-1670(-)